jgi:hypothetical protein
MDKRGEILIENVVFIILNVVFLSIIILFLVKQSSSGAVLEETYAKRIALIVDSSRPEMKVKIDMEKGLNIAEKNNIDFSEVVVRDNQKNLVFVKLTDKGGYGYSFFNEVELNVYPERDSRGSYTGLYILTISEESLNE